MTSALQYAKALHALMRENPKDVKQYVSNLISSLKRRGHEKHLPRIALELEKLEKKEERLAMYREVTPQMRRTDILLQLYKKLVAAR